ncbi:MAG: CDC27 family protein [Ignavibacteria bacterium]
MNNLIKKADKLTRLGNIEQAINVLDDAENLPLVHPEVYVRKAIYMQLSSENEKYNLKDIEGILKKALAIDDEYINALIELGDIYYIENEFKKAKEILNKAIKLNTSSIIEAVTLMAKCIEESDSKEKAIKYLEDFKKNTFGNNKIDSLIKEFRN